MVILAKDRNTPSRSGDSLSLKVAAASTYFGGAMLALDANGRAVPGQTATTLKGLGRSEEYVDNSAGADDATSVNVGKGIFQFANSAAGDLIAAADIGNNCYMVDDQTVAKTDGAATRSVAGKIFDVDADGVWVDFR